MDEVEWIERKIWSNRSTTLESRLSRVFDGVIGAELGLYLESGPKVWMISARFSRVIHRLDYTNGQTLDQSTLLFVDNASSNGTLTNLSPLQHTQLEFLPMNTAPLL